MKIEKYLSDNQFTIVDGIYVFNEQGSQAVKQNRINVLEDIGKGRVWKNVYAHYFRLLFIMRWLRPNTMLVDFGCGRGWLMDIIYRNQMKVSYIGIDLSLNSLRHASAKKFKYPRLLMRANCVNAPLNSQFADYVVCYETIEHNNKDNAEKIIRRCYDILKPGGLLFVSTPNRKGQDMVFPKDHIYEWEFNEMSSFLRAIGLDIQLTYGCFGKKQEILDHLSQEEKTLYQKYSDYFGWHVLSPFFSVLHPEEAQGAVWLCRKPHS